MKKRDIIIVTVCIATAFICIVSTVWGNYKNEGVLSPDAFYSILATFIGICATIIVGFQIASFIKIHETERQIKTVQQERDDMLKEKEKFQEEMEQTRIELSNICNILSDTISDNGKTPNNKAKIFTQILSLKCMAIEKNPNVALNRYQKLKKFIDKLPNIKDCDIPIAIEKLEEIIIPKDIEFYTQIMKLHFEIIYALKKESGEV